MPKETIKSLKKEIEELNLKINSQREILQPLIESIIKSIQFEERVEEIVDDKISELSIN